MKLSDIHVGKYYRVNDKNVYHTVRVENVYKKKVKDSSGRETNKTFFDVLYIESGNVVTFRSAARFLHAAPDPKMETPPKPSRRSKPKPKPAVVGPFGDEADPMRPETPPDPATEAVTITPEEAQEEAAAVGEPPPCRTTPLGGYYVQQIAEDVKRALKSKPCEENLDCTENSSEPGEPCSVCGGITPPSPVKAPASPSGGSGLSSKVRGDLNVNGGPPNRSKGPPHLIVIARAGTGKTTTLVSALQVLRGIEPHTVRKNPETGELIPVRITPSPQQQAVWDAVAESKGEAHTACFVAYNRSIAAELKARVPPGCDAMTTHGLGYRACLKAFGNLEVSTFVVRDHLADILGVDSRLLVKERPDFVGAVEDLTAMCKSQLRSTDDLDKAWVYAGGHLHGPLGGPKTKEELWTSWMEELCERFDIDGSEEIFRLIPQILQRCKRPRGRIDYNDQVWLPLVLNLPVKVYDLLMVDEAQDLDLARQALVKRAGRRIVVCGDPRQAIYQFAGADSESMDRLKNDLADECPHCDGGGVNPEDPTSQGDCPECGGRGTSGRGVQTLSLTVTRRCAQKIVAEARRIVPDFEAHPDNPEGVVDTISRDGYRKRVREGDFVLSRTNAPLLEQCFAFITEGIKANVQGRDIGKGLISLIKKLSRDDMGMESVHLIEKVDAWKLKERDKENAKRDPSEDRLKTLNDKATCLLVFCHQGDVVKEIIESVEQTFGSKECPKCRRVYDETERECSNRACGPTKLRDKPGVRLSSIHKSKGLESERVFLLRPKPQTYVPRERREPTEQEMEQEANLEYVAETRAIGELYYVV